MQVYTLMWFRIKRQHDISHATLHVFETISKCQMLPLKVRDIVIPVVERNAYGAHPESILCAMISSMTKNTENLHGEEFCAVEKKTFLPASSGTSGSQN